MRVMLSLAAAALAAAPLAAQIRASERGRVSQVVDGTTITLDYARPRVRGRPTIFGDAVSWREVWTPGANMATTLETDHDIVLDGHAVPKGKYSIWMVVDSATRWTMVLDTVWQQYHEAHPPARGGQIRWPITSAAAPPTEVLTWSFPDVTSTGGSIRMVWADRAVVLPFRVPASHPVTTAAAEATPLVGRYQLTWLKADGTLDTSSPAGQKVDVTYEAGALMANWSPKLWGSDDRTYLIRLAPGWFTTGFMDHGEVVDVFMEWVLEFDVSAGTASAGKAGGFEIRGERDVLYAKAVRAP